jgi:hypothetical protein
MRRKNEAAGVADAVAWVFGGMNSGSVGHKKELFWAAKRGPQSGTSDPSLSRNVTKAHFHWPVLTLPETLANRSPAPV